MTGMIEIDLGTRYQAMEGFGASGAWWAQDVGGWQDEKRERIVRLLFDRHLGIGLSIFRYNMGAGSGAEIRDPWRRAETFEVGPGVYDWSCDRNAIWVMKAARDAGVEKFVAFVNSPPARMTRSGLVSGTATDERKRKDDFNALMRDVLATWLHRAPELHRARSNLRPDRVDEFARYMADVVRHLREVEKIPIGWISPINEPQWGWCRGNQQEGCHYTPDECASVAKALVRAIRHDRLDVKVSMVESGLWLFSSIYMQRLLDDPDLAPYLDHLAVHSYESNRLTKWLVNRYVRRHYPRLHLWMSEWVEMRGGKDTGIESALALAKTVYTDLTVGGVTCWQYWIAVSKYDFHDGLIYVDEHTRQISETKRLWAMGNLSRFVRPRDVRVEARSRGSRLNVVAFHSQARREICAVVINSQSQHVTARLSLLPASQSITLTAFETSQVRNLEQVYRGQIPDAFGFAPRSVTTLVFAT